MKARQDRIRAISDGKISGLIRSQQNIGAGMIDSSHHGTVTYGRGMRKAGQEDLCSDAKSREDKTLFIGFFLISLESESADSSHSA